MGRGALDDCFRKLFSLSFLLFPVVAAAQDGRWDYATGDGTVWTRDVVDGAVTVFRAEDPADAFVLGADCSATSPGRADLTWGWANGGWAVEGPEGTVLGFPRQEAPMDAPDCRF